PVALRAPSDAPSCRTIGRPATQKPESVPTTDHSSPDHILNRSQPDIRASSQPLTTVGTGEDITIRQLAEAVAEVIGFGGVIEFDPSKPDGTPRKLMDVSRLSAMGIRSTVGLNDGLAQAYADFAGRTI
ncbi:MAG: hypothetical protein NFW15_15785, partial [Candidatus Accumulibacter sp.]|nr:hypothetical protein [Accumulibacter sp.]MCM8637364.1 hypothetical protein [Accumulibacter sp.]MCM8638970.1 hypothetical protein [Accumulibacter sp.]